MQNPEQKLIGIFDSIFSKVIKRALSQDQQERLRQELAMFATAVRALAGEGVAAKLAEMQKNVMAGFELVEKDHNELSGRVANIEELFTKLGDRNS